MVRLDTDINIGDFFNWWGRELAALLPKTFAQFFAQGQQFLLAQPDHGILILTWVDGDTTKPMGRLSLDEAGKLDFQALLLAHPGLAELDLILRLPEQDAVSKQVYLPAAAADNLSQIVSYELDRFTPFKPEQVYFALKKSLQKTASDQIKVTLIVTLKENLNAYINALADWQLKPTIVDYQGVENNFDKRLSPYNLLPEQLRVKKKRTSEFIINSQIFLVLILLCLIVAMPVWMESQTVKILNAQIDAVAQDVKAIDNYKIEIDKLFNEAQELIANKKQKPSALAMLNGISELMGDDTWLTYLKYNNNKVQIQGHSPTASSLIGALEASPLFQDTHFVSPVTQDKKTGLERFQVAATVKQGSTYD